MSTATRPYTVVPLEQGTEPWRTWRSGGIGASDAPAIMGESRFKTAGQLLQERRGEVQRFKPNAAMRRGTELEPEARRAYMVATGRIVYPVCLQSLHHDWLRASLDGFAVTQDAAVEIKCGEVEYRAAVETRAAPAYYYGQLQHILAVTGLSAIDYWCYWPDCAPVLVPVPRDDAYIERLLRAEFEFWQQVQRPAADAPPSRHEAPVDQTAS